MSEKRLTLLLSEEYWEEAINAHIENNNKKALIGDILKALNYVKTYYNK